VLTIIFCGFLGILWQKNLINKVIAMDVMSSGVVAYFVLMASRTGLFVPISTEPRNVESRHITLHIKQQEPLAGNHSSNGQWNISA